MLPIKKVNFRYAKWMSSTYKISWAIQNELYFNLRSYPMRAEVKAEWNFEPSFIKSNKIGIHSRACPTILLYLFKLTMLSFSYFVQLIWSNRFISKNLALPTTSILQWIIFNFLKRFMVFIQGIIGPFFEHQTGNTFTANF